MNLVTLLPIFLTLNLVGKQASSQNVFPASGNVGIGTSSPTVPLEVHGSTNDVISVIASGSGRGGIYIQNSNSSAQATMYVDNNRGSFACYTGVVTGGSTNAFAPIFGLPRSDRSFMIAEGASSLGLGVGTLTLQPLVFGTNNLEWMRVTPAGNVLISKTTQVNSTYKLDVNGSIRANNLVVNTTGADFVFDKDYRLPSLHQVETYISIYHHLDGIASAAQMNQSGLDVGQHSTILLQKIEELTLYMIEQQKQIENQNRKLRCLQQDMLRLKKLKFTSRKTKSAL